MSSRTFGIYDSRPTTIIYIDIVLPLYIYDHIIDMSLIASLQHITRMHLIFIKVFNCMSFLVTAD